MATHPKRKPGLARADEVAATIARRLANQALIRYLESALQLARSMAPGSERDSLEYIQGDLEKAATLVNERLDAFAEAE